MSIGDKWIYFAGPLFSMAEREFNKTLASKIEHVGYAVFLPQDKCEGLNNPKDIFESCIKGIDNAWCIVAIYDGADADSGTSFEAGYAYAKGIPVISVRTDFRNSGDDGFLNLMLSCSSYRFIYLRSIENNIELLANQIIECLDELVLKFVNK